MLLRRVLWVLVDGSAPELSAPIATSAARGSKSRQWTRSGKPSRRVRSKNRHLAAPGRLILLLKGLAYCARHALEPRMQAIRPRIEA